MKRSLNKIIWGGIFGIIFFLILVGILNIVSSSVSNSIFQTIVKFVNANLLLILWISVWIILGNIFQVFIFPFNIIYPWFNAIAGVLWVKFIFRIFELVSLLTEQDIYGIFEPFYTIAAVLVFIIILTVGYVHILSDLKPKKQVKGKTTRKKSNLEWEDVRDEFKEAAFNLASTVKDKLEPKKQTKKKRKRKKK